MIGQLITGTLIACALAAGLGSCPASACNRMDGCEHDFQKEDYEMMHGGRYADAMRQGQENIRAFRSLTDPMPPRHSEPPPPRTRGRAPR